MTDHQDTIECIHHGTCHKTYVCQHLAAGTGQGFVCFENPDNPYPDAWCDECERARMDARGWNEESEKVAGITLRCHRCYLETKARNER